MSSLPDGPAPHDMPDLWSVLQAELRAWRIAHPHATFAEIEAVVEAQLGRLRAQLIAETVPPGQDAVRDPVRPTCPACAVPLVERGTHPRTVRVLGDQPVTLHRPYWTCPRCGGGVFPPG
jgi:hypothetical protein